MEIYEHVFDSLLLALVGHNTSFRANCPERLTPPPPRVVCLLNPHIRMFVT